VKSEICQTFTPSTRRASVIIGMSPGTLR
jgi:hypothetical protein